MSESMTIAAYEVDGDEVLPTDHSRGPWFGDQQHGACLLALLTRFLERVPSRQPMRFARITADLSRAVPLQPMVVSATALRDGSRVQSLEARIAIEGATVARAVATRIRVEPGLVPAERLPPPHPGDEPPPFATTGAAYPIDHPSFHDCLETRVLDEHEGLHNRTWYRLAHPLVLGESPSPSVRVASIADMIISSGSRLGEGWVSINPEVSLQLEREPEGEWLCVTSTVRFTDDGLGTSEGVIHDRKGRIGRSSKSVLNFRRT